MMIASNEEVTCNKGTHAHFQFHSFLFSFSREKIWLQWKNQGRGTNCRRKSCAPCVRAHATVIARNNKSQNPPIHNDKFAKLYPTVNHIEDSYSRIDKKQKEIERLDQYLFMQILTI